MLGTTIAHYKITSKLGQGSMGEVYRATDTKLEREVAIKVLPKSFAQDKERLARFDREAKTLATLNHPAIAAIYGLEQDGDSKALALELVEGEDLSERLKRGRLPVEEALEICKQIAEALEAAHEKGIIHRDLKPSNIKITGDGKVKILDFGLAKGLSDNTELPTSTTDEDSPTITDAFTMPGTLLGTAAYMSPEQARGKVVDKRSDIWSFGCVLYECLTGKRLFQGEDMTETLATIIKGEPDWSALPEQAPATILLLLRKCLVKDRKRRLPDIAVARIDLEEAIQDPTSSIICLSDGALQQSNPSGKGSGAIVAGMLCFAIIAVGVTWMFKPESRTPPIRQFNIALGDHLELKTNQGSLVQISPDGSIVAFKAASLNLADASQIFIRPIDQLDAKPIEGTEGVGHFCFSPGGDRIAFGVRSSIHIAEVNGGSVTTLVKDIGESGSRGIGGLDWMDERWLICATTRGAKMGIYHISLGSGKLGQWADARTNDRIYRSPELLPDGKTLVFTSMPRLIHEANIMALNFKDGSPVSEPTIVIENGYGARYLQSGHLIFLRDGSLYAGLFDSESLTYVSDPVKVLEEVAGNGRGASHLDVSSEGLLVYLKGQQDLDDEKLEFTWVHKDGSKEPFTGLESGSYGWFKLSPNGRYLAYEVNDKGQDDIFIYDIQRGINQRFINTPDDESYPVWSPNGDSLIFHSAREDAPGFYWKKRNDLNGLGRLVIRSAPDRLVMPWSWHPSKPMLLALGFADSNNYNNPDLKLLHFEGDEERGWKSVGVEDFLVTSGAAVVASYSPDGNWVLYSSEESGRNEIHVRPFPAKPLERTQVSTLESPSDWSLWSQNQSQFLFSSNSSSELGNRQIFTADYQLDGETFTVEPAVPWEGAIYSARPRVRSFDIDPSGNRVLMVQESAPEENETKGEEFRHNHVVVFENFFKHLNQLIPNKNE